MKGERSPFGELVRRYRHRLGLSQQDLAAYIVRLGIERPEIAALGTMVEKTIANIEAPRADSAKHVRPRPANVRLLAAVFGLQPDTPEYEEFMDAASLPTTNLPALWSVAEDRAAPRSTSEFVVGGRETQLAQLVLALDETLAGVPQAVFVSGEAGIGKTSLIHEVAHRAFVAHPTLVVVWSGSSRGAADVFHPVRHALRLLIGDTAVASPRQLISPDNGERLVRRAPAAIQALATHGDSLIERLIPAEAVIAQGHALGLRPGSWQMRLRQIARTPPEARLAAGGPNEQVARLLQMIAGSGPLLLVIEDLHWTDPDTIGLLLYLLDRLHDRHDLPLLLVGSLRPTPPEPSATAGAADIAALLTEARRCFMEPVVDLAATVGRAPGRAFISGALDREANRISPAFRELLFARTGGHPLFTLELLRWFQTHGTLKQDRDGTWFDTNAPADHIIPEGISAVIRERLAPLTSELRRLLQICSVQGEIFAAEITAEVAAMPPDALAALLEERLVRQSQWLTADGTTVVGGRQLHRYRFGHALFHEYVYASLSDADRASYHARTAEVLQQLYGLGTNVGAGEIARQFELAGRDDEAARAYKDAGDFNMRMLEYDAAARCFARAIELADRISAPALVGLCFVGLANCARSQGKTDTAVRDASEALSLARAANLPAVEAHSLTVLGVVDYDAGRTARAVARLMTALPLLDQVGDQAEYCRAQTLLSHVFYTEGKYDEALRHAERSAALAALLSDEWLAVDALVAAANCQTDLGLYRRAIAAYEQAVTQARAAGYRRGVAIGLINIGLCRAERREWELASDALHDVLSLVTETTMPRTVGNAELYLALVAEGRGDLPLADRHYTASLEMRRANRQTGLARDSVAGLLRIAIAEGDLVRMRELYDQLAGWLREHGVTGAEFPGRMYLSLYRAQLAQGDTMAACAWLAEGIAFLNEHAALLADPAARQSYLDNVPVHHELRQLAGERRGGEAARRRGGQAARRSGIVGAGLAPPNRRAH